MLDRTLQIRAYFSIFISIIIVLRERSLVALSKPRQFFFALSILLIIIFPSFIYAETISFQDLPEALEQELSNDGLSVTSGAPLKAMIDDPNPSSLRRIPLPPEYSMDPSTATSTLNISYIAGGSTDKWGEPCSTFPTQARTVFTAAANVWANILNSDVPIQIKACWATNMGSSSILGYSGGGTLHRDFSGATRAGTFYSGSLANSLNGSDLSPTNEDMHITYNSAFDWYYGTDGNTPVAQHDLFSVVLHEIAHGLNFSGGMYVSGSTGYWYNYPYPNIYDTFMRDGSGNSLISAYSHGTSALGSVLRSNNLYFHGTNAMAVNGNSRVKIYAPSTWSGGSSYSHLDYNTFNNTSQQLMVYAISAGEAIHDPGTITKGLLNDLGWDQSSEITCTNLSSGVSVNVDLLQNEKKCYIINVSAKALGLNLTLNNISTDLDLYTNFASPATQSSWDCRPYEGGTGEEICNHPSPSSGDWYVMVHGSSAGSGRLTANIVNCTLPPSQPSSISYPSTITEGTFSVSWPTVSGATSYVLQRANNPAFNSPTTVYIGPSTTISESRLKKGEYYYRVSARNGCGSSLFRAGGVINITVGYVFPWMIFTPAISKPPALAAPPLWGADNAICCSGGWASFNLSSGGTTKHAVLQSCSSTAASWEGFQETAVGIKGFSWNLTSANCGSSRGSFNFTLQAAKAYIFYSSWTGSGVEIRVIIYDNNTRESSKEVFDQQMGFSTKENQSIADELITTIPILTPTGFSKGQCIVK